MTSSIEPVALVGLFTTDGPSTFNSTFSYCNLHAKPLTNSVLDYYPLEFPLRLVDTAGYSPANSSAYEFIPPPVDGTQFMFHASLAGVNQFGQTLPNTMTGLWVTIFVDSRYVWLHFSNLSFVSLLLCSLSPFALSCIQTHCLLLLSYAV